MIQSYQEEIDNLKANYESAPEDDDRQKTDWTFHPASYYMKTAEDGEDEDWGNLDKTDKLKVIGDCDGKMAYVSASNRSTPDLSNCTALCFTGMMNNRLGEQWKIIYQPGGGM